MRMRPILLVLLVVVLVRFPERRRFVGGDPARFARLISEQLTPADLITAG